jgi:flagellar hook-associated protein 3 FlgL
MSITGPGSVTATTIAAQNNMMTQLNTLAQQLGTNQAATTYSGLGSQAGLALQLSSQLSALGAFSNTISTVGTTLDVAQTVLGQIGSVGNGMQQTISQEGSFSLDNTGQTQTQATAASDLDQILSLLNTQVGGNYLFSGSAVDQPSVAPASEVLNGNGAQAGLAQLIPERLAADQGANGLGRLNIPPVAGSTVTISEQNANSPFGFQLASVNSSLTGANVTGPSGTPPAISVDLTANPNVNDSITFNLTLPDGSSQSITLTATNASPPGPGQFTIGTSASITAGNLQTALTNAVSNLAQTALPAASAIATANDFFEVPPQIVNGPPFDTATSLVNGTQANTVFWYTGENGSTPALQTATAQVGPSLSIAYGMRATEPAITSLVANVAALAATTFSASDPNAAASYKALTSSVTANLAGQSGTQSISDIQADLANAQTTAKNAGTSNTQTQATLQDLLQGIEGVNQDQIGAEILTLQNNLSASLSLTGRLAQLSLVNFLGTVAG